MSGMKFLINIDVPDIDRGARFYMEALGLELGRRFDDDFLELLGGPAPIYLLREKAGTTTAAMAAARDYARHWCPIHLDFVVQDAEAAVERALAAGATLEMPVTQRAYGRLAVLADPFGHGFCLIEFVGQGYDALVEG
jgi:predicted enzyme related to lactoylglutathione lyase